MKLLLSFICVFPFVAVQGELVMVYSIQRHGARNVLPKSSELKESNFFGGPTLLPQGKKQCYEAGVAFRQRYIDLATCGDTCLTKEGEGTAYGVVGQPNVGYSNYNTLVNSSALHRTLLSADTFLLGIFEASKTPTEAEKESYLAWQMVPVFTVEDSEDYRIRAYTKCPAYDKVLDQWYQSDEFKAKVDESKQLRDSVAGIAPGLNTSLTNWWNVYDGYNVYRTYAVGDALPEPDEDTYEKIVDLAMWLETAKMRSNLTSYLLGGALLGDVMHRIANAADASAAGLPTYYKFLSVSSHYNTQLGLLSALGVDKVANSPLVWLHKIPSTAAVLVFELHKTSDPMDNSAVGSYWVRPVAQDGPGKDYQVVPLPCAKADAKVQGACSMEDFFALGLPRALGKEEDWCNACENTEVSACQLMDAKKTSMKGEGKSKKLRM